MAGVDGWNRAQSDRRHGSSARARTLQRIVAPGGDRRDRSVLLVPRGAAAAGQYTVTFDAYDNQAPGCWNLGNEWFDDVRL